MSRIFISHHNSNNREALALKMWLEDQGWRGEIFVDFDPVDGIRTGTRWKAELNQSCSRCEAMVCLVSPSWLKSGECIAEFRGAENRIKIFIAYLTEVSPLEDITREWQSCRFFGEGPFTEINLGPQEPPVRFLKEGLARLKVGIIEAGISRVLPKHFRWPPIDDPKRAPYRGLEPFESKDAGVYFGRDAEILRGVAKLYDMRRAGDVPLFVILGASGTGKSSFLRAGLLPRLKNEDHHFYPLNIVRPERSPLFGDRGLAQVIASANIELKLEPVNLGEVKSELRKGPLEFSVLLHRIQQAACARLGNLADSSFPPTLVLPIDQAEELFNADATEEAQKFLNMIGTALLGDSKAGNIQCISLIVVSTIRSDRYEYFQAAPELKDVERELFDDLRPMHPTQFKEVITGPANRAFINGRPLEVKPDLVNRLVSDCTTGADTLPLLALTLARLYQDYGSDGDLTLQEYRDMGGMSDVIRNEAESILSNDKHEKKEQLARLREAFIPFLVTVNRDNNQPMRRVARMADLPQNSRPLIQAFIEKRLLLSDSRNNEQVVEVSHESLFRQWEVLTDWINAERDDLKEADKLEEEARAWTISGKKEEWLRWGERLRNGEALAATPAYRNRLESVSEFILASREAEERQRQKEEHVRQNELRAELALAQEQQEAAEKAKRDAKRIRRWRYASVSVLALLLVATVLAVNFEGHSKQQSKQATALRVNDGAKAIISGVRPGGSEFGMQMMLAAHQIARHTEIEGSMLSGVRDFQHDKKIIGTGSLVLAIAFSLDGRKVVSGSRDHKLRLWNAQTGEMIGAPFGDHGSTLKSVAFSPDGTKVVSGSEDGTLRLWDVRTAQPIGVPLQAHERGVWDVAFSPDGTKVVSAGGDKTLRLWDVRTERQIGAPLVGHNGAVGSVAFSFDGSKIVSGGEDKTLRLWNVQTGQPIGKPFHGHQDWVTSVAFSPDGTKVVSGSGDMTVRLWDVTTQQLIGTPIKGHNGPVFGVVFTSDGTRVISGSQGSRERRAHTVMLWDVNTQQQIGETLYGNHGWLNSMALSLDGSKMASGNGDNTLRLWNVPTELPIGMPLAGHSGIVSSVAFSSDGTKMVSGSQDQTLRLWDARTSRLIGGPLLGHKGMVRSVTFSPDGAKVVSAGDEQIVRLWDVQTGQLRKNFLGHESYVDSIAFSRDGSKLVSGSLDRTVRLWDVQKGTQIGAPLSGHSGPVGSVSFSPDDTKVVSGSADKTLRLWNAQTGQPIGEPLVGHEDAVTSVAFSPDGTMLVSGGRDHMLRLWDVRTRQTIGTPLAGHRNSVTTVAFSPDGRTVASGSDDQTLRLWDVQTRQPIGAEIRGHESGVTSLAFSPDGTKIASASSDKTVRLWPAPKVWPDLLCSKLTRNMSRKQWREHVSSEIEYVEQCSGLPIPSDELELQSSPTSEKSKQ